MNCGLRVILTILCLLAALGCESAARDSAASSEKADRLFINGNIITMDDGNPRAQAIAVKDGVITFVGADKEARTKAGPATEVIDLGGRTVVPGMIDAHCHVLSYGSTLAGLDLSGTKSLDEILEMVRAEVKNRGPGEWILGRGWDQNDWEKKEFPAHERLSRISPDNPVCLTRICGHASFVNEAALKIAGITKNTPEPEGGRILKDPENGEPTGVLVDSASSLVAAHIPGITYEEARERIVNALADCLRVGLTSVHDAGVDEWQMRLYRELATERKLKVRIYAMVDGSSSYWRTHEPDTCSEGGFLTTRSIKLFADGALGSRGAALLEPYCDEPGNSGLLFMSKAELESITREAIARGYQVCTHAIGDRANRIVLDAYESALALAPAGDCRLRVEHAQVLSPSDIPRFVKLGVIPSMQPTHCTSDMYWAGDRLGPERVKGAYAWRSLIDTGTRLAGGSDFPVESNRPLWGIYAAVARQDHEGFPERGWHPGQRMTAKEALKSFTIDAAYAAFEEKVKGSLETGKLADFVVLSRDILKIAPQDILKTEVELTIVGGEVVYRRGRMPDGDK